MAIATEIGRLQGAKQDLISRLKAKGVSVPENATLEEITPLIDNISGSEDLDAELTEQETLISQLSTILDSKASGGGGASVETCTGNITYDNGLTGNSAKTDVYYTNSNFSIENIKANANPQEITTIKGSLLYMADQSGNADVMLCENATLLCSATNGMLFSIDANEFRIVVATLM